MTTAVQYAPGEEQLYGAESWVAMSTDDPAQVTGCEDCLELVAEDLEDTVPHMGHCLHCPQEITAQGGVAWRQAVRKPCPRCGRPGW